MGLENTFQKAEKLPKEKKLEVITTKEATIKDLEDYFQKNKYKEESLGFVFVEKCRSYLSSCMNFLKIFKLTPEIIEEFNIGEGSITENENLGLYLSAMIQTSYNQGFNDFKFEKVNANSFGSLLKGQSENPIKITTKTLKGNDSLGWANGCLAEITNYYGHNFGYEIESCTIRSENEETLEIIKKQVGKRVNNRFELKK